MKKTAILITCIILFCLAAVPVSAEESQNVLVYETDVAPEIDGVLDDLYTMYLVADTVVSGENFILDAPDSLNDDTKFYACWDSQYFYTFVQVPCNEEHVAYMDNETEHYIFNAHYLMTAICPEDPVQDKYFGTNTNEGGWDWSALNGANYMYEWTVIKDSRNGDDVISCHFNNIQSKAGFEFACTSEDGFDCYEHKIPLASLTTSEVNGISAKVGTIFGYGFSAGLTDVGCGYISTDDVVYYSDYFAEKTIVKLVTLELASDLVHDESEEESSEESVEESTEVSEDIPDEESDDVSEKEPEDESKSENSEESKSGITVSDSDDDKNSEGGLTWLWIAIGAAVVIAAAVVVIIINKKGK